MWLSLAARVKSWPRGGYLLLAADELELPEHVEEVVEATREHAPVEQRRPVSANHHHHHRQWMSTPPGRATALVYNAVA
jgi:hypothetical protein